MRKALILAGAAVGLSLLARRLATMCGRCNFAEMVERMPEDAPPRWMFRNITGLRENTERSIELLSSVETVPPAGPERTAT